MAGAPVPAHILEKFTKILSADADSFIPYGATEALPVSSISGRERLKTEEKSKKGAGTCVGRPLPGVTVRIIKVIEGPVPAMKDNLLLGPGERGEIIVKGNIVTPEYFHMKEQTALAKISDGHNLWHRMGDIGYFDEKGLLWFCGRKDQRVITNNETMFTVPCEAVFNQHPKVFRSALVGIGDKNNQRPVIIIEPHKGEMPRFPRSLKIFKNELLEMGRKFEHTAEISDVLFYSSFPVDIRHNVKISREKLSLWAEEKLN
jgi:acyl-CoA synthetase (AMP-forming)/AMP-acid ligase II